MQKNENWEPYLLPDTFLLHSCLNSLPLTLFYKLFYMTKATNLYVLMIIYD